jgi:hypothetical protein
MRCVYSNVARDDEGDTINDATITVYLAGTTTLATIYTTFASTSAVASSKVTTNSNGEFTFYVDRFDYDSDQKFKYTVVKTGFDTRTYDNVDIDRIIISTYTISADKTVSTHIGVPKGVLYSVASGKTLTIPNIVAGNYPIFSGLGTVAGLKKSRPEWFGASPSASAATNVLAFQDAIDSLASTAYRPASVTYDASIGRVLISQGEYDLNDKLTIGYYTKLIAEGQATLVGTDVTKDIIYSQHPYHNEIRGITFAGGKSHINIMNGTDLVAGTDGLEGVMTKITDCYHALSADFAIKLARNATNGGFQAIIKDTLAFHNSQFLYVSQIDGISINDVFLEPDKAYTADDTAQIVNYKSAMYVDRLLTAHSGFDDPTQNRWFDNYGHQLSITNSRFGAESGGGLPIVYNYTDALAVSAYPYLVGGAISITNNALYTSGGGGTDGGTIVLKSGLPNVIVVEGNSGMNEAANPVINTISMTGGVTLATYLATADTATMPIMNFKIKTNALWGFVLVSTALDSSSDLDRLYPWLETNSAIPGDYGGNVSKVNRFDTVTLNTTNLYGKSYSQTSVSPAAPNDTISIVDTGITATTGTSYLVNIMGTANNAGSASNRDVAVGILTIIYNTGAASIVFTPIIAAATLTVTPTISSGQIRIAVGAYTAGEAGYNQVVRIARLL